MDATGSGLVEFLNYVAKHGLVPANTAGSYRAAATEVLKTIAGEGWEAVDLTTVDADDYTERFERLRMGAYKPDSMLVYKSRFRSALAMFAEYRDNPSGWRYRAARPSSVRPKATKKPAAPTPDATERLLSLSSSAANITYPFPLRPGVRVSLVLPEDLTRDEAKRLAVFIESLSLAEPLRLTSGSNGIGGGLSASTGDDSRAHEGAAHGR